MARWWELATRAFARAIAAALQRYCKSEWQCDQEVSKTSLDGNVSKRKQGGHSVVGTGFGFST